ARTHRPKMWVAGAKEKALDIAARYADGWLTVVPAAYAHVEDYAEMVKVVKQKVESYGRDPEQFQFGVEAIALINEDEREIEKAIDDSEFVTCFASIYGW